MQPHPPKTPQRIKLPHAPAAYHTTTAGQKVITPNSLPSTSAAFAAAESMLLQASQLRKLHRSLADPMFPAAASSAPEPIAATSASSPSFSSAAGGGYYYQRLQSHIVATFSVPCDVSGIRADWNENFQLALDATLTATVAAQNKKRKGDYDNSSSSSNKKDNRTSVFEETLSLVDELLSHFARQCELHIVPFFVDSLFDPSSLTSAETDALLDPLLQRARAQHNRRMLLAGAEAPASGFVSKYGSTANLFGGLSSVYGSAYKIGDAVGEQPGGNAAADETSLGLGEASDANTHSGELDVRVSIIKCDAASVAAVAREIDAQRLFLAALLSSYGVRPLPVTISPMWLGQHRGHAVLVTAMPRLVVGPKNHLSELSHPDFAAAIRVVVGDTLGFLPYSPLLSDGTNGRSHGLQSDSESKKQQQEVVLYGPPTACAAYGVDGRIYVTSMVGLLPSFPSDAATSHPSCSSSSSSSPSLPATFSIGTTLHFLRFLAGQEVGADTVWSCGAYEDASLAARAKATIQRFTIPFFDSLMLSSSSSLSSQSESEEAETAPAAASVDPARDLRTALLQEQIHPSMLSLYFAFWDLHKKKRNNGESHQQQQQQSAMLAHLLDQTEQALLLEVLARSLACMAGQRTMKAITDPVVLAARDPYDLEDGITAADVISALTAQLCSREGQHALWHGRMDSSSGTSGSGGGNSMSSSNRNGPDEKQQKHESESLAVVLTTLFPGMLKALHRRLVVAPSTASSSRKKSTAGGEKPLPNPLTLVSAQALFERFAALTGTQFAQGVSAASGDLPFHFVTESFSPVCETSTAGSSSSCTDGSSSSSGGGGRGGVAKCVLDIVAGMMNVAAQHKKRSFWAWRRELFCSSKSNDAAPMVETVHTLVLDKRVKEAEGSSSGSSGSSSSSSIGMVLVDALHAATALNRLHGKPKYALDILKRALNDASVLSSLRQQQQQQTLFFDPTESHITVLCHVEAAMCYEALEKDKNSNSNNKNSEGEGGATNYLELASVEIHRAMIASGRMHQRWVASRFAADSSQVVSALAVPVVALSCRVNEALGKNDEAEHDARAIDAIMKRLFPAPAECGVHVARRGAGSEYNSCSSAAASPPVSPRYAAASRASSDIHQQQQPASLNFTHLSRGVAAGSLGMILTSLGRTKEAERCLREELASWDQVLKDEHQQQLSSFSFESTVESIQRAAHPPQTPELGALPIVLNNLGCLLVSVKKYDDAVALYQREIRMLDALIRQAEEGEKKNKKNDETKNNNNKIVSLTTTLDILKQELHLVRINLATAFMHQTQWSHADMLFALAQEAMETTFGANSIQYAETLVKRAMLYFAQQRHAGQAYPPGSFAGLGAASTMLNTNHNGGSNINSNVGSPISTGAVRSPSTPSHSSLGASGALPLLSGGFSTALPSPSTSGALFQHSHGDPGATGEASSGKSSSVDPELNYKHTLLQMLQDTASHAYDVLDAIAAGSGGEATIPTSGVSVRQLIRRCCQLGASGAKEQQLSALNSMWEERSKKRY